ncbi:MAG: hypothetical protein ACW986_18580 [Promethearchaeota archaeon]|jgi:hypothetical protein
MNNNEPPRPNGIDIKTKAPQIETKDIYESPFNLIDTLKNYNGILIDFFRGNW